MAEQLHLLVATRQLPHFHAFLADPQHNPVVRWADQQPKFRLLKTSPGGGLDGPGPEWTDVWVEADTSRDFYHLGRDWGDIEARLHGLQRIRQWSRPAEPFFVVEIAEITDTAVVQIIGKQQPVASLADVHKFLCAYTQAWGQASPPTPEELAHELASQLVRHQLHGGPQLPGCRECRFTLRPYTGEVHQGKYLKHVISIIEVPAAQEGGGQ